MPRPGPRYHTETIFHTGRYLRDVHGTDCLYRIRDADKDDAIYALIDIENGGGKL